MMLTMQPATLPILVPPNTWRIGVADQLLLRVRAEGRPSRFHLIDQFIDDRVVADFHAVALGKVARLRNGAHIEADDKRVRRGGERDVGSLIAPTPADGIRTFT